MRSNAASDGLATLPGERVRTAGRPAGSRSFGPTSFATIEAVEVTPDRIAEGRLEEQEHALDGKSY